MYWGTFVFALANGTLEARATIDDRLRPGVVSLPHGWHEANTGHLTDAKRIDPETPSDDPGVIDVIDTGALPAGVLPLGEDTEAAKARGTALHLLLQHLPDHPPSQWPQVAAGVLGDGFPDLFDQAKALLTNPDLHHIFTIGLSEVALTAPWGDQHLLGTIDRLIVQPDRVLAVDFKSNRTVPATAETVPEGILRQMGAYVAALTQIYPDRVIEPYVLWTRTANLMALDPDLVSAALKRAALP